VPRFPSQAAGIVSALPPARPVVNDFDDELATEVLDPARHRAHLRGIADVAAADLRATTPAVLSGADPVVVVSPAAASPSPPVGNSGGTGPSSKTLALIIVAVIALALGAWGAFFGNGIAAIFGGIVALVATAAHLLPRKAP
jgi:hypothetical protein